METGTFIGTSVLGLEPVELGGIPRNLVRLPENPEAEGAAAGVACVSATSSVSRISPGTISSNCRNKYSGSSDIFLEVMRMQMMHDVQHRSFDKEYAKEKREAEDMVRTERKEKEDKDRIHFEKMFLMAIGGGVNMTNMRSARKGKTRLMVVVKRRRH